MKPQIRFQLSTMMFLNYFVWGTWYVTMGTYLNQTLQFSGQQIGLAYGAAAIAAMISPFFVGMIADRFFNTERVLGVLHLVGAVLIFFTAQAESFSSFYPLLLLYTICYMPTISLTNSLAFQHMTNPDKEFPGIRVLGTIGWIVIGLIIGFLKIEPTAIPFYICAGSSVAMGLYAFSLPATPPKAKGTSVSVREILGLDALKLMGERSFAVLVISSVLICIPLSFYYGWANPFLNELGVENAAGKMTLGQMSEIFFLLVMPVFFVRLGVKKMMLIGMAAWALRYVFFAYGDNQTLVWMLYMGILLHGICYDFFFVTGQIFVDQAAPKHLRNSAQGLITFATYGIGMFLGTWASGLVADAFPAEGPVPHDWQSIWLIPAVASAGVFIIFAVFFRDQPRKQEA
jgi:nucleoside transporter